MPDLTIAIDESGGIEPLLNYKTLEVHVNHPHAVCFSGASIIVSSELEQFEANWNSLCKSISDKLCLDYLPPIHLKLMWGTTKPKHEYSNIPNPYVGCSHEEIYGWVVAAFEILKEYERNKRCMWFLYTEERRKESSVGLQRYYASDEGKKEVAFLKKIGGSGYRAYHVIATSPLLITLGDLLYNINVLCARKYKTAEILLDNVEEYTGFDALSASQMLQNKIGLDKITSITKLNHGGIEYRNHPLLQAADLRLFFRNKAFVSNDNAANTLLGMYPEPPDHFIGPPYAYTRTLSNPKHYAWRSQLMLLRYELARTKALAKAPYLEKYIISSEEFEDRVRTQEKLYLKDPNLNPGVFILKKGVL